LRSEAVKNRSSSPLKTLRRAQGNKADEYRFRLLKKQSFCFTRIGMVEMEHLAVCLLTSQAAKKWCS
ncbi:MAG: hypothetical protein MUO76_18635, partial [Anaerolineaceae bacterium]|nr:hypothetical protein [Anaerolineaceae bacterium]